MEIRDRMPVHDGPEAAQASRPMPGITVLVARPLQLTREAAGAGRRVGPRRRRTHGPRPPSALTGAPC